MDAGLFVVVAKGSKILSKGVRKKGWAEEAYGDPNVQDLTFGNTSVRADPIPEWATRALPHRAEVLSGDSYLVSDETLDLIVRESRGVLDPPSDFESWFKGSCAASPWFVMAFILKWDEVSLTVKCDPDGAFDRLVENLRTDGRPEGFVAFGP
jgi:hypothetical protein